MIGIPTSFMRLNRLSVGRRGVPDDIAGALGFLVSDLSGFMTGQTPLVISLGVLDGPIWHRFVSNRFGDGFKQAQ